MELDIKKLDFENKTTNGFNKRPLHHVMKIEKNTDEATKGMLLKNLIYNGGHKRNPTLCRLYCDSQ